MKKYKLVIPDRLIRWVHPFLLAKQGEISDSWDNGLKELGWLVEIEEKSAAEKWIETAQTINGPIKYADDRIKSIAIDAFEAGQRETMSKIDTLD